VDAVLNSLDACCARIPLVPRAGVPVDVVEGVLSACPHEGVLKDDSSRSGEGEVAEMAAEVASAQAWLERCLPVLNGLVCVVGCVVDLCRDLCHRRVGGWFELF